MGNERRLLLLSVLLALCASPAAGVDLAAEVDRRAAALEDRVIRWRRDIRKHLRERCAYAGAQLAYASQLVASRATRVDAARRS